jgi:hypothetical protein
MNDGPKNGWAFVIDTDSYAGNFEREMTAYLTGIIGECEVGEELVEREIKKKFEQYVQSVPDEHGCYRPTSCWKSPNSKSYNSVAIFFYNKPTQEQIDFLKERVKNFDEVYKTRGRMAKFNKNKPEIKILGFRLIEFKSQTKESEI